MWVEKYHRNGEWWQWWFADLSSKIHDYLSWVLKEGTPNFVVIKRIKQDKTLILCNNKVHSNHLLIEEKWKIREIDLKQDNLNQDILNRNIRSSGYIEKSQNNWNSYCIKLKWDNWYTEFYIDEDGNY